MSFPSRRLGSVVPALALLSLAAPIFAQTTATLSGVVKDASGAVVANATVTVTGNDTGTTRVAQSDSAGIYIVPSLLPGNYKVTVEAQGFGLYTVERLQLDVDQKITVNAQLSVASAGQTVEVNSANSIIVADTVTVGSVLDQKTVQELPLNGRHFLDLTVLTPGGVTAPSAGSLTAPSRGLGANSYITAGNREDSANFQINGVNLNDNSQNQITFQPSINTQPPSSRSITRRTRRSTDGPPDPSSTSARGLEPTACMARSSTTTATTRSTPATSSTRKAPRRMR